MEAPTTLNVSPLNAPHKDQDYLSLAEKYFQVQDITTFVNHLQTFCQIRDNHANNSDVFGIWESNLRKYFIPSIHVFLDIIHQCCANYDPVRRAVMCHSETRRSPSETVIFYITAKSINEMIHFHPTEPPARLSMGLLLDQASKLSTQVVKMFMLPECQPTNPPPYL